MRWQHGGLILGLLPTYQDWSMNVEIAFESGSERRWENRFVGDVGFGLLGYEEDLP
jgi:hypothetical protein